MEAMIKKFMKQSSHYLSGNILTILPRFISFPILTRALSTSDYGTMSLIMATLTLSSAIGKLGLQHASIRFYPEYKKDKSGGMTEYYSTLFLAPLMLGLVVAVIIALLLNLHVIPESIVGPNLIGLFVFACLLIPIRSTLETGLQFLRSEQRTKLYNTFTVILRYGVFGLTLYLLFHIIKGLYGFFAGMLIANSIGLLCLYYIIARRNSIKFKEFSVVFLKECLYYSVPMVFVEIGHTLLSIGDRYLIQYYMGAASLGLYAAGYNLASYVGDAVVLPFRSASTPIYLEVWSNKGEQATKQFLSSSLTLLLLLLIPVGVGFSCIAEEFIMLLASEKYRSASVIVPWIMGGVVIYGTRIILDAPLYIYKRTGIIMVLMFVSCIVNLGMNVLMIPAYGILGAAIATLIANLLHVGLIGAWSFRLMKFKIEYDRIFIYIFSSSVMFWAVESITMESAVLELVSKIIVGITVYGMMVVIWDKKLRVSLGARRANGVGIGDN